MMARASARRMQCQNNLRQVIIATLGFESAKRSLPLLEQDIPCEVSRLREPSHAWSMFTQILGFLESEAADDINRKLSWGQDIRGNGPFTQFRPSIYMCPDVEDIRSVSRGGDPHMAIAYAVCWGLWNKGSTGNPKVYAGLVPRGKVLTMAEFRDGTSYTMAFAEVVPGLDYMEARLCTTAPIPLPGFPSTFPPTTTNPGVIMHPRGSHLQWVDARPSQTGFTTWAGPNQIVYLDSAGTVQGNWLNIEPTAIRLDPCQFEDDPDCPAALIRSNSYGFGARSLHASTINVALVGGAVITVSDDIDLAVWRGLSTRNGSEDLSDFFQ